MSPVVRQEGRVGYIALFSSPVNAIDQAMRRGLLDAVTWAERQELERVILDLRGMDYTDTRDTLQCDAPLTEPHLPDVLDRIEASSVPWIAAVRGSALGNGLELIMACRYRIAAPGTRFGLPEVLWGVVPGAGGTQRLTRLIGLRAALDLLPFGGCITVEQAKDLGLIDDVDADPLSLAERSNPEWIGSKVPVRALNSGVLDEAAWQSARPHIEQCMVGQEAPLAVFDLLRAAQDLPYQAAVQLERAAHLRLRGSAQSRALRHLFFAEHAAQLPAALLGVNRRQMARVVVAGSTTAGAGIACALLQAGLTVCLFDDDADALARAKAHLTRLVHAGMAHAQPSADAEVLTSALTLSTDQTVACYDADLVIEATGEDFAEKRKMLRSLEAALPATAVLATNTSYLVANALAATLEDPSRCFGLHFFAPDASARLLEIMPCEETADQTLASAYGLAKTLGRVPVQSGICEGSIGSRILARYQEAADTVLMDGSTPWEVDEAMIEFGFAMGPYEAQDLSGLDIAYANRRRQDATRDPSRRYIPIADRMIELGKLGKKVGAGWYRYPGGGGKVDDPIVADLAIEEAYFANVQRVDYAPGEIRRRLVLAMINEACDILHEGIATCAADIDLVSVLGLGFPRWRGGLMHFADNLGVAHLLRDLNDLAKGDPLVWRPSALLVQLAAEGGTLARAHVS